MTALRFTKSIAALLLDIEGTTTPIDFVYNVLFPYARLHAKNYLETHRPKMEIDGLINKNIEDERLGLDPPLLERSPEQVSIDTLNAYVQWLMDRDRKTTALKSLQGKIWEDGYRKNELRSQIFEDVPFAFKRWREQDKLICIYSSGSVLAQKLLFANTEAGDLSQSINGYYDTNIGGKKEAASYSSIAADMNLEASSILFISDVTDELDAAATAGLSTLLCVRPGNHKYPPETIHKIIKTFDEILP